MTRLSAPALLALVAIVILVHADAARAQPDPGAIASMAPIRYRDDAIGVRLAAGHGGAIRASGRIERLGVSAIDALARELGASGFESEFPGETGDLAAFYRVHLPPGTDARSVAGRFEALTEIEEAWPIAIMPAAAIPNDSLWSAAYYFRQPSRLDMHAPEAWDITTGDTSIVVAIIDTGVYTDHPDLAGQIWTHWAERHGIPGVDDDGNGFVDDDHGWDFVDLAPGTFRPGEDGHVEDNDPNDFAGHGTAVAGLVGARTNNRIGVAGTVWKTRLIPLRVGWSSSTYPAGEGDVSYMARAIRYATRMGAQVINCSFTTANQPDLVAAADAAIAAGITIVAASGNLFVSHYLAQREDVISVTGTGPDDKVLGYVTLGPTVDLAAAGSRLTSTTLDRDTLGNRWADYTSGASGTSFSAPLVSGSVALMQADRRARGLPPLTPFDVRMRLMDTADDISQLNAGSAGFGTGRLNLLRALTDPPGSRIAQTRLRLAGPAIPVTGPGGRRLLAVVTTTARLMLLDAITGATIRFVTLPGPPIGGLSAAQLGTASGIGLFVATHGQLNGYDLDLEPLPGWPVSVPTTASTQSSEAVLADLDDNDVVEVLWAGGRDGRIHQFSADGRPLRAPIRVADSGIDVSLAVSDLDGVPGLELAVSTTSATTVRKADGTTLPWNIPALGSDPPMALIARLGHDPLPSVIFGYDLLCAVTNGTPRWIYPPADCRTCGSASQSPIVADLNGDGGAEVIQLRSYPLPLAVIDSAGRPLAGWQTPVITLNADGLPLAGPVGARGQQGILLSDPSVGMRVFDARGADLRVLPKPGMGGRRPMIGDIDGDGSADVVAGSYASDDLMLYDSGPGSWRPASRSWLTARANHGRTGSLVYAPPLSAGTLTPPLAISDLTVLRSDEFGVELQWTTPASPGGDPPTRFEVRHSTSPFGSENYFDAAAIYDLPPPGAPGTVVRVLLDELGEGATHYLAVRTRGSPGNWSALSNRVTATTFAIPPDPVADLRMTGRSDTTLALAWTATGDNRSSGRPLLYRIHASETPIDSVSFESAPWRWEHPARLDAGGTETRDLAGVPLGRHLWFAMVAVDSAGNTSGVSNRFDVTTTPFPPSRVVDLKGFGELGSSVRMSWTAAGEDDVVGRTDGYLFRASESPIDSASFDAAPLWWWVPATHDPGAVETTVLAPLLRRRYWIAAKVRDHAGNLSRLSNVVTVVIAGPPGSVENLTSPSHTDTTVRLDWTAPAATSSSTRAVSYQIRARTDLDPPLEPSTWDAARLAWDIPATANPGGHEIAHVGGLAPNAVYKFAVAPVDADGNRGALSSIVSVGFYTIAPGSIGPLQLLGRSDTTATVQWITTGDDGDSGRPRAYLLRAGRVRITAANFSAAELAWDLAPATGAGATQSATLSGFLPGQRYYLAAMAVDWVGNLSPMTNVLDFVMVQSRPAVIEGLGFGPPSDTIVTLVWTGTGEDGRVGRPRVNLVRASEDSITESNFDSSPRAWEFASTVEAGGRESAAITGLEHGRRYWFSVVARDRNGNRSPVPNSIHVTPVPVPPAVVGGLRLAGETDSALQVEWVATGEDADRGRASSYAIHAADHPLDESNFSAAPLQWESVGRVDAGGLERAALPGFAPDRRHWVAIVARDRFGNRSPVSRPIEVVLRRYVPAAIADLRVLEARETDLDLRWTATGEDGNTGRPSRYLVRVSRTALDSIGFDQGEPPFEAIASVDAGGEERITIGGLETNRLYWVAAVAIDHAGNRSPVSNVVSFWLGRLAGREGGALEVEHRPSRVPVRFLWRVAPGAPPGASLRIYDLAGRSLEEIPLGAGEGGIATWDGRDRDGHAVPPAIYFARLIDRGVVLGTRVVLVR